VSTLVGWTSGLSRRIWKKRTMLLSELAAKLR
jgi:hypothetical protein